jgi:hypothetical protein
MSVTTPTPKPNMATIIKNIKAHLIATYPGCQIKTMQLVYAIYLQPIGYEPDFFLSVNSAAKVKQKLIKRQIKKSAENKPKSKSRVKPRTPKR